jgi:tetratricopeptide (TPR) repeat protein
MKKLIHEAHRRSLLQVLGIYLAGSWIALQVVAQLADSVGFPDWVEPFALVLLVIGLPIVMATAFVQEGVAPAKAVPGDSEAGAEPMMTDSGTVIQTAAADAPAPTGTRRLFSWRNALGGGALAFLFLVVVTIAWILMRQAGIGPAGSLVARGVIDDRAPVIVADFSAQDSLLARAATEAFRVDLSQSPNVQVLEPAFLVEALDRMQVQRGASLDPELARELAVREGIPAVVVGEITPAGRGFILTSKLVDADDGSALTSVRETATDTAEVLDALDRLSKSLRERIGESYLSLRSDPALAAVTTGSLEALQLYSEALRAFEIQGDNDQGIALLEEAVAIDPGFAMAWRKMGVELRNQFAATSRVNEALTKAFENRDRLTERERLLAAGSYYTAVAADYPKAIAEYERMLDRDPADAWALNNVSILYGFIRDEDRAYDYMLRSFNADSSTNTAYTNLAIETYRATGDVDSARAIIERAKHRFPGNPAVEMWEARYAALGRDYAEAEAIAGEVAASHKDNAGVQTTVTGFEAVLAAAQGKLREYDRLVDEFASLALAHDEPGDVRAAARWEAWTRLYAVSDTTGALRALDRANEAVPIDGLPFADREHVDRAALLAALGRVDDARVVLEEFEIGADADLKRANEDDLHRALGQIALSEGDPEQALVHFRQSDRGRCSICPKAGMAQAFEAAGQQDSALAWYESYLEDRQPNRMYWDQAGLGYSLQKAARLADSLGDTEKGALYYAQFVELWADADAELQPQVEAARSRLEAILRERG